MDSTIVYEIIGYAASALIVISLMMNSLVRLRVINLIGAIVFVAYGVLIAAWPIVIVNGFVIVIDAYFLWKAFTASPYLSTLQVSPESRYLAEFLTFHAGDIAKTNPGFTGTNPEDLTLLVLRDMEPAGAFVAEASGDRLAIRLDWVKPGYRDFKLGRHLFGGDGELFLDRGYRVLSAPAGPAVHDRYLQRMGFTRRGNTWTLELAST